MQAFPEFKQQCLMSWTLVATKLQENMFTRGSNERQRFSYRKACNTHFRIKDEQQQVTNTRDWRVQHSTAKALKGFDDWIKRLHKSNFLGSFLIHPRCASSNVMPAVHVQLNCPFNTTILNKRLVNVLQKLSRGQGRFKFLVYQTQLTWITLSWHNTMIK